MRLLLVADLHYSLPQFDWVLERGAGFRRGGDGGDHLDLASIVDGRAQSVVVRKYFNRLRAKTKLVICSGNHDLDGKNAAGEKAAKWSAVPQQEGIPSDGDSFDARRHVVDHLPVVGWSDRQGRHRRPAG